MAVHLSVTTRDMRRLLELGDPARLQDGSDPFPMSILTDLAELVACDDIGYATHDAYRKTQLIYQSPVPDDGSMSASDAEAEARFYWQHFWEFPACSYPDRTGDYTRVNRPSDFRSTPGFALQAEHLSMAGIRHMAIIALRSPGPVEHRIRLARTAGHDFTDREMLLLSLVRPHLAAINETMLRRVNAEPDLTTRQRELLCQVAAGLTNRQIGRNLLISEGTVRKHLENIYTRLDVTSRTAAIARVFQNATPT
jgi:DNA-binding CsgD family transcriptional regulator